MKEMINNIIEDYENEEEILDNKKKIDNFIENTIFNSNYFKIFEGKIDAEYLIEETDFKKEVFKEDRYINQEIKLDINNDDLVVIYVDKSTQLIKDEMGDNTEQYICDKIHNYIFKKRFDTNDYEFKGILDEDLNKIIFKDSPYDIDLDKNKKIIEELKNLKHFDKIYELIDVSEFNNLKIFNSDYLTTLMK
jgi:hypothetical protein